MHTKKKKKKNEDKKYYIWQIIRIKTFTQTQKRWNATEKDSRKDKKKIMERSLER